MAHFRDARAGLPGRGLGNAASLVRTEPNRTEPNRTEPERGLGFGWAGAAIALLASLASFVQAGSGSVTEESVFPIASIGPATRPAVIARRSSTWRAERSRMSLAPPTFRDQALGIDDYERCVAAVRPVSCAPPEDPPLGEQP